jgi:hypothetical protein
MPDGLSRRDVLVGTAAVAGASVLSPILESAPVAAVGPPILPWPYNGCLTGYAALALPRSFESIVAEGGHVRLSADGLIALVRHLQSSNADYRSSAT